MDEKNSIVQWKQANDIFEQYIDIPINQALVELENDKSIIPVVKKLVIRLLRSLPADSTSIEHTDLSFINSLQETIIDLSGSQIGDYHLICQIGSGGMAQVYKGERTNTDIQKFVAIKILTKKQKLSRSLEDLFEKEQITLSKLSHSNIISFHHGGLSKDGTPYLVMEYLDKAQDISTYIHNKQLNTHQVIELILPIIDAIGFAHQQLIVHKDIKPSNVLVDNHGKPFLLDFGIASISESHVDQEVIHIYTPSYASPEQFLKQLITTSSDIFSVVAMLLDLLTEQKRSVAITSSVYSYPQDKRDIDSLLSQSSLDSDLKNILNKGLQEQPLLRYQSAQELKQDLINWQSAKPVNATNKTGFYLFQKFIKRNPLSSFLVSVLIVAIAFSLSTMFFQMNHAEFEAKKAKQVTNFLIESIQASDPDLTKGADFTVIDFLKNAKLKIQESSLDDRFLTSSLEQNIGSALFKVGQYKQAEELLTKAISSNAQNYDARLQLSQLYLDQKQYDQSLAQFTYLNLLKQKLSLDQQMLLTQIHVGILLLKGNFDKALTIITSLIDEKNIGLKQNIKNNIIWADILDKMGNSNKAVEVLEYTLALNDSQVGKLSTTHTKISFLLADTLTNINPVPYQKLIALYQKTLATQIKLYGEKHPLVAKTYLKFGFALKSIGDLKQAKESAEKARFIAIENFGENHILVAHIDLLKSQIDLIENNLSPAINTLKHVVHVYEDTYGFNHFETNQVKTTLALYMIKANQGVEAKNILLSLYDSQKEQLGENHQATLYVVLNLNKAYNLIDDFPKAISSGIKALETSQKHLGKEFVITIGLQMVLGESYLNSSQATMAIRTIKPLLSLSQVTNNNGFHKRIAILLIKSYIKDTQNKEAKTLINDILTKYYPTQNDFDTSYTELQKLKNQL